MHVLYEIGMLFSVCLMRRQGGFCHDHGKRERLKVTELRKLARRRSANTYKSARLMIVIRGSLHVSHHYMCFLYTFDRLPVFFTLGHQFTIANRRVLPSSFSGETKR